MSEYAMLMLMKKHVAPAHPRYYLVWLGLSTVGFVFIWYLVFIIGSTVLTMFGDAVLDAHYRIYEFILNFGGIFLAYVASAATMPFALWVLKKLNIQDPIHGSIGIVMAITFAFVVFFTLVDYYYRGQQALIPLFSGISVVVSMLLYGVVLRRLKHVITKQWFIIICVILPLLVFSINLLNRMTSFN